MLFLMLSVKAPRLLTGAIAYRHNSEFMSTVKYSCEKCPRRFKRIQNSSFKALSETEPLNVCHFYAASGTVIEGNGPPRGHPVK